ncbi:Histone-lysine N-methyltransferase SETMAR [Eumeta japonica]|uniref:Histone-lysine N-methyltransferase SETMAR n=1 Tax=Eumeta variegata TaxID=151549 RepID=A0A4C1VQL7_EUMVA|nr:Histone-lysine N-methyltransferase SETMAR [Eumeta japonica]
MIGWGSSQSSSCRSNPTQMIVWPRVRAGVIHYNFVRSGRTITADLYCQQLQTTTKKFAIQQPRLVNCSNPLMLQDSARPHTSRQTVAKLEELRLQCP